MTPEDRISERFSQTPELAQGRETLAIAVAPNRQVCVLLRLANRSPQSDNEGQVLMFLLTPEQAGGLADDLLELLAVLDSP